MDQYYKQPLRPTPKAFGVKWLFYGVNWSGYENRDGSPAEWHARYLFYVIRWYHGTAKVDATETLKAWFIDSTEHQYVMVDAPKELKAFRLHATPINDPDWRAMGSI